MDNLINGNGNPPPIPQRQRTAELPLWQNYNQSSTISMNQPFAFHQPFGSLYNNYNYQPSFNYPQNVPSSFPEYKLLRNAEESSKNTFQSIESVVNAFVSIVNMLNSTHNAVFNSFRALIGVVDQFRHLKHFIISTISTILIPLIRQIRYIWRSLLAILHLKPRNYANSELIWANINGKKGNSFNFVIFIFWIIAIGGPYFVYKWISNAFLDIAESANDWSQGRGEHYTAQALYNFNGLNADELSFSTFDILRIAPKCKQPNIKDWLLASNSDGSKIGLIPINYIKLLAKEEGIDGGKNE